MTIQIYNCGLYLGMKIGIGAMLCRPSLRNPGTLRKPFIRTRERATMGVGVRNGTGAGCQGKLWPRD
jgi:hypothetical protein